MFQGRRRRILPGERLEILLEGLQGNGFIAEVCRRYGVSTIQFYTWKKQLYRAAPAIFCSSNGKPSKVEQKLREQLRRKDAVIAELTAENLELKKRF